MGYNRQFLKVISIAQIIMSAIFLALGMADRYEARFIYTSYVFTPCWISALVLPAGIMGVILVTKSSPSSTLVNALSSVSMTSAIVSGIAVYRYKWAVSSVLDFNLLIAAIRGTDLEDPYFANKDTPLELTDHENTTIALSSLVAIFSTIEVTLAVCAVWSSDSLYQPTLENQVGQARNVYNQFGAGQISLEPTNATARPMVADPVSSYNAP